MSDSSIVIQRPSGIATKLVLLFHGVGATPADMVALGETIAAQEPNAFVVAVAAPHRSDFGHGLQWFSVAGVTEDNRSERVNAAMPRFAETVRHWQVEAGVDSNVTTLVGFSQGAIMSLESAVVDRDIAAHVISISGRFSRLPNRIRSGITINLVHGSEDSVILPSHSMEGAARLTQLGVRTSVSLIPGLGHGIGREALEQVLIHMAV